MMAIPFVYFSILASIMYSKRRRIDMPILICILYATSGLIGLFMGDPGHLVANYRISFIAAFSYCFLLSLCLYPVAKFSHLRIRYIYPIKNEKLLKGLAWTAMIWFFAYAIASWSQFKGVITGDMLAMRTALYQGTSDDSFIMSVPAPIRFFISLFSYVFGCHWILIFMAFFCLLVQKLPIKYFFFFLIGSLACPWGAVLGVDRSAVAAYLLSFVGVIVFYWQYMGKVHKRYVAILGLVLIGLLLVYLGAMTVARFAGVGGDDMDSVNSSLAFYLGHSYLYFCYYFDNFNNPFKMSNLILPFTNKFIFGDEILGGMRINSFLEAKTGKDLGYFYTFVGQIQITAGHVVAILFCFLLFFIGIKKLKKRTFSATPNYAFLYLFFSSFMLLGLFAYYYQSPSITFSVFVFLILFRIMGYKNTQSKIYIKPISVRRKISKTVL